MILRPIYVLFFFFYTGEIVSCSTFVDSRLGKWSGSERSVGTTKEKDPFVGSGWALLGGHSGREGPSPYHAP